MVLDYVSNSKLMIFSLFLLFFLISIILLAAIVFSQDEFHERGNWRVELPNGRVDWSRLDAGRFFLYYLTKIWAWLLFASIAIYIYGRI